MGVYDNIVGDVVCPHCGELTKFECQIKWITHDLRSFKYYHVGDDIPAVDAVYTGGSTVRQQLRCPCSHCKEWITAEARVLDGKLNYILPVSESYKWHLISEEKPPMYQDCLVVDEDGDYGVGYYREEVDAWDSPNFGWLEVKDKIDNKEAFTAPCRLGKIVAWTAFPKYKNNKSKEENKNG